MYRWSRPLYYALILGAIAMRVVLIWRPIDYTTRFSYRECDYGMIARNFWRGDMNILYPRVDWGGSGPGYVQSELPVLPWLMAASYRVIGYHEQAGRFLSLAAALIAMAAFFSLAKKLLPSPQAKWALVFFCHSPIFVDLSTNIQPDCFMLLFIVLSARSLVAWDQGGETKHFLAAGAWCSLAILLKLPALYLGFVFAAICFEKYGRKAIFTPKIWALGVLILLPPTLWYLHAHRIWREFGNSLGMSDAIHMYGLQDIVEHPGAVLGDLSNMMWIEFKSVYAVAGVFLLGFGWRNARRKHRIILYWLGASLLFYVIFSRTTGGAWATYYHVLSVPPTCILLGLGLPPRLSDSDRTLERGMEGITRAVAVSRRALPALTLGMFVLVSAHKVALLDLGRKYPEFEPRYRAMKEFADAVGPDDLVAFEGGHCMGSIGSPIVSNDSTYLFWMDRRGFMICKEEISVESLRQVRQQGAEYFVGRPTGELAEAFGVEFELVAEHQEYMLYKLKPTQTPEGDGLAW